MTVEELYKALKEIERATDAAEREKLMQALVRRVVEYTND